MTGAIELDPEPITNWLLLFLAISGAITVLTTWTVKALRKRERMRKERQEELVELIKMVTRQIQPDANGGSSLADLHSKFDAMVGKVEKIERRYNDVIESEEGQRKEWHARYLEDQARVRREWIAFFIGIRHIMKQPLEEQLALWDRLTEAYVDGTIVDMYPDERTT